MQQDHQVPGTLVEDPVARIREPDPQLAQLPIDLRSDGKLGRQGVRRLPVQMLFNVASIFAARFAGNASMNSSTGSRPRLSR